MNTTNIKSRLKSAIEFWRTETRETPVWYLIYFLVGVMSAVVIWGFIEIGLSKVFVGLLAMIGLTALGFVILILGTTFIIPKKNL